jgi:hypothetical protein
MQVMLLTHLRTTRAVHTLMTGLERSTLLLPK